MHPTQPIYRLYTSLPIDPQAGLGGKLLYAGEIDFEGRNLLYAANIAGAASLAASADVVALRHAMRDGVIDFFVNSLEEALRILKNEIRKHQTVSVGVAADPASLVDQMLDRGVLPDLIPASTRLSLAHLKSFVSQGAHQIGEASFPPEISFVTWQVDRDFARSLPRLDELAKTVLPAEDHLRHRWLKLAPRYLGRLAQRQHGVAMTEDEFIKFEVEVRELLTRTGSEAAAIPTVSKEKVEF